MNVKQNLSYKLTEEIILQKKKILEMIDDQLTLLYKTQDTMFKKFEELNVTNNNFYDIGNLENHLILCQNFSNSVSTSKITIICKYWEELLPKVLKLEKKTRNYFISVPKKIAAFCLFEGRYYTALNILYDAIYLNYMDMNVWFALLWWAIFLNDWRLLGVLLKRESSVLKEGDRSEGYSLFINCCNIVFKLNTDSSPLNVAEEIAKKLNEINASEKKTYLFSSCKALLRNALVNAIRLRGANIEKLGDPICHRNIEAEIYELILQNRFPQLTKLEENISLSFKMKVNKADEFSNADELLRLCSSIADYFEGYYKFVEDLFDVGLAREAEAHSFSLWKTGLYLGVPYRTLRALSFIFYIKTIATIDKGLINKYAECLNVLITPSVSAKISKRQSVKKDDEHILSNVDELEKSLSKCDLEKQNNIDEIDKNKIEITQHDFDCDCVFCLLADTDNDLSNWHFALEVSWIQLMFFFFDVNKYDIFRQKCKKFQNLYLKERTKVWNNVTADSIKCEIFVSPHFSSHWINGCISLFLQIYGELRQYQKLDEKLQEFYLTEVIPLTKFAMLKFRSANLLLNFLIRMIDYQREINLQISTAKNETKTIELFDKTSKTEENDLPKVIRLSYSDQKDFAHLFFREWRQRNCLFLALSLTEPKWSWHRALYFIETCTPSIRQTARLCYYNKNNDEDLKKDYVKFYFNSSNELKKFVKNLPEDTTLLNFVIDDSGKLWLIRCHAHHDPIILPIVNVNENKIILEKMREILKQSDDSVNGNTSDSIKFWSTRRKLDKDVQVFLEEWQKLWFEKTLSFLLPLPVNFLKKIRLTETLKTAERKFINFGFSRESAVTLVRFCNELNQQEWTGMMQVFAKLDSVLLEDINGEDTNIAKINSLHRIVNNHIKNEQQNSSKRFTLLVVPPQLNFLPWECLPIYKRAPLISRIPSAHFLDHLLDKAKKIPKKVNSQNSFYVLNPGGDLTKTQKRMAAVLEKFQWEGIVGKIPTKREIQKVLAIHDMFLYMGHGSGGRYFGRSSIRESNCNAVSILMGCSSVCILEEGMRFDGRASLYEYLIAKCPCVIGCLWMVTDGEIDRFFVSLLEHCFGAKSATSLSNSSVSYNSTKTFSGKLLTVTPITSKVSTLKTHLRSQVENTNLINSRKNILEDTPKSNYSKTENKENENISSNEYDTYQLLVEGVVEARKACKLPYLTGCAVVCYGIPIISKMILMDSIENSSESSKTTNTIIVDD